MLDALEAMADDNQSIAPRAMILNRKYRTLVSSWIEPLQEEADLGFEIDYVARYDFVKFWVVIVLHKSVLVACMALASYLFFFNFLNDGVHMVNIV